MPRGQFDALRLDLADGDRVHAYGRPELFEARGDFRLRVLSLERFGLGDHLAALERLKQKLAAEGLFAAERKRPLPLLPRRIGLVTGNDAAAKRDVLDRRSRARFPPASVLVAETYVQGPRAPRRGGRGARRALRREGVDVIVVARGGGSFEDLLPFSDERLVRAIADCPVPVVTAVGPRAGHAALRPRGRRPGLDPERGGQARRSRPDGAARPARQGAHRPGARRHGAASTGSASVSTAPTSGSAELRGSCSSAGAPGSSRAPGACARFRRARRSSAATPSCAPKEQIIRSGKAVGPGDRVEIELAEGGIDARVEETR